MQPYFFPYIGYWQLINAVDKFILYDDVAYINRGWVNRNRILLNGKPFFLTIPLCDASQNKLINQVQVSIDERAKRKILETIRHCYHKAPFFETIYPVFERVINQDETNLSKFLEFSIRSVCNYLDIKTELICSSSIPKDDSLRGQDKVIHICKLLGAEEYINSFGGRHLYSPEEFQKNGLKLSFLEPEKILYPQYKNEFVPNLSIIDVLMFNSKKTIKSFLSMYKLCES